VTLKAFLLVKTIPITISHVDLKHQTRLKQCKDLLLSVTLVDFQFPLDKLLEKFHITKINSVALISLTSSFVDFELFKLRYLPMVSAFWILICLRLVYEL
jgi:hypothetical protein